MSGHMLAQTDLMEIGLTVFEVFFSAIVSILLWKMSAWQQTRERGEDAAAKELAALRQEVSTRDQHLHSLAAKLVDERFRAMSHEVNGHIQALLSTIDGVQQRLKEGDGAIDSLGERDHRIELATATKLEAVKDFVREHCASHSDMRTHQSAVDQRMARIEDRLGTMGADIAVLRERTTGGRKASQ